MFPWVDVLPSVNSGSITLRLNPDDSLTAISGTGFDIGSTFAKKVVSGNYIVTPYHTPSARYYITVKDNTITWLGDSNTGSWRNLASGTIDGNSVVVNWQDPPPGTNSGTVTLSFNLQDQTLTVIDGSGFDIGAVFSRLPPSSDIGITGTYQVSNYHTPSARYYITQTSDSEIVWFGDSKTGDWRNTAVGTISSDKTTLQVSWTDIPPSTNSGQTTFTINSDRTLTVTAGSGFEISSTFSFDVSCNARSTSYLQGQNTNVAQLNGQAIASSNLVWIIVGSCIAAAVVIVVVLGLIMYFTKTKMINSDLTQKFNTL